MTRLALPEPVDGALVVRRALIDALAPPERLSLATWTERYRVLESAAGSTAEPGPYRFRRTPYWLEVAEVLSPGHPCETVVLMKGAQVGATELGMSWIGYAIDEDPTAMMCVLPTEVLARRWSRQRLQPMLDSDRLKGRMQENAGPRDVGGSMLWKEFAGGVLAIAGANSPTNLRSMSFARLFADEVDAFPGDTGGEGDPVELARRGQRTFAGARKTYLVSTPRNEGTSRIKREFLGGDRRYYEVPCPFCAERQRITWPQVHWDDGPDGAPDPSTAHLLCVHCEARIEESHKGAMLAQGEWVPEVPALSDVTRSYHLSALYSPPGWRTWAQIAAAFISATEQSDQARLQVWVNQDLGETWRTVGAAPDWEDLYRRRETYERCVVPAGAALLTAGVDVQGDRLELEVVAWGPGLESWSIDRHVILGDPAKPTTWEELERYIELDGGFRTPAGAAARVSAIAIDTGYETQSVYRFGARLDPRRWMLVKGRAHLQTIVGPPRKVEYRRDGKRIQRGITLREVGTDVAKSELYGFLRQKPPLVKGEPHPVGYCHFAEFHEEEYFRQLTAERLTLSVDNRGRRQYRWEQTRPRNEALDIRVYARAAASALRVERWEERHWQAAFAGLGSGVADSTPRKRRRRRSGGSGWMDPGRTR